MAVAICALIVFGVLRVRAPVLTSTRGGWARYCFFHRRDLFVFVVSFGNQSKPIMASWKINPLKIRNKKACFPTASWGGRLTLEAFSGSPLPWKEYPLTVG
jgi:hypothetical protein